MTAIGRRRQRAGGDGQGAAVPAAGDPARLHQARASRRRSTWKGPSTRRPRGAAADVQRAAWPGRQERESPRRRPTAPRPRASGPSRRASAAPPARPARRRRRSGSSASRRSTTSSRSSPGAPALTIPLAEPAGRAEGGGADAGAAGARLALRRDACTGARRRRARIAGSRRSTRPTRRSMEARFGHDFSRVRVHDDARGRGHGGRASTRPPSRSARTSPSRAAATTPPARRARLLAHELTHVVQQSRSSSEAIHRDEAAATTSATPARRDYEEFVDEAIRFLDGARDNYRTIAQIAQVQAAAGAGGAQQQPAAGQQAAPQQEAPSPQAPAQQAPAQQAPAAAPPAAPGLSPDRLHRVLEGCCRPTRAPGDHRRSSSRGDQTRAARLRTAYLGRRVGGARRRDEHRPSEHRHRRRAEGGQRSLHHERDDLRAALLLARRARGHDVQATQIDTPDALFDLIETTEPDRMIRRIDIFCHGTIEPTHQIKFGATWFRIEQIESVAAARARGAGRSRIRRASTARP